jgi:hypothetical protein
MPNGSFPECRWCAIFACERRLNHAMSALVRLLRQHGMAVVTALLLAMAQVERRMPAWASPTPIVLYTVPPPPPELPLPPGFRPFSLN